MLIGLKFLFSKVGVLLLVSQTPMDIPRVSRSHRKQRKKEQLNAGQCWCLTHILIVVQFGFKNYFRYIHLGMENARDDATAFWLRG